MKTQFTSFRKFMRYVGVAAITAFLVGCGGGGGGGSSAPTATSSYPIESVISSLFTSPQTFTLTNSDPINGVTTLVYDHTPMGDTSYNGVAAKTAQIRSVVRRGLLATFQTDLVYFQISPFKILGKRMTITSGSITEVASLQAVLPATAQVGAAGSFYKATWTVSGLAVPNNVTWALQADTSATAFLCILNTLSTDSDCYKINASGNILGVKTKRGQIEYVG